MGEGRRGSTREGSPGQLIVKRAATATARAQASAPDFTVRGCRPGVVKLLERGDAALPAGVRLRPAAGALCGRRRRAGSRSSDAGASTIVASSATSSWPAALTPPPAARGDATSAFPAASDSRHLHAHAAADADRRDHGGSAVEEQVTSGTGVDADRASGQCQPLAGRMPDGLRRASGTSRTRGKIVPRQPGAASTFGGWPKLPTRRSSAARSDRVERPFRDVNSVSGTLVTSPRRRNGRRQSPRRTASRTAAAWRARSAGYASSRRTAAGSRSSRPQLVAQLGAGVVGEDAGPRRGGVDMLRHRRRWISTSRAAIRRQPLGACAYLALHSRSPTGAGHPMLRRGGARRRSHRRRNLVRERAAEAIAGSTRSPRRSQREQCDLVALREAAETALWPCRRAAHRPG
jgi:hypothetical protein